jgi:hypothetical protein
VNEIEVLRELNQDLQRADAQRVVYLEGKSDLPIFLALLGSSMPDTEEPTPGSSRLPVPNGVEHRGVLVRGLSGAADVKARVEVAGRKGYAGVYGIVDGDGEDLATLTTRFTGLAGPCFSWPAYCIENLLVKTGWPAAWGAPPDWTRALLDHVPHVALNRIHRELHGLRLWRHNDPRLGEPLMTVADATAALARDKHRIAAYDVEARLATEVAAMEARVLGSLDEGHALVNGKWLVDVFAPGRIGPHARPQRCRDEWTAHAVATGGLAEVRELWQRITGRPA